MREEKPIFISYSAKILEKPIFISYSAKIFIRKQ